ncbi:hypothetical protein EKG37_20650 [Robertmurraya yapensis]|uniref:Uncharacterized protein n=1 Tax=Bacillus yapensis TaxID=2492960 RepID=A0A431VUH0_9BACI|nr:hypothetical protein [Bacillus yapensis]RTR26719.1 hypothetical protein EKG37_20650 [Bacillus yapensis]TKS93807.1 hypothetical protein FAR12_20655 [Bacillus yapensis]
MNGIYGYVDNAIQSPINNSQILFGSWSPFKMEPSEKKSLIQYRDFSIVGVWHIQSVSSFSSSETRTQFGISVIPESCDLSIESGDLFFSEELFVTFKRVNTTKNEYGFELGTYKDYVNKLEYGLILFTNGKEEFLAITSDEHIESFDYKFKFKSIDHNTLEIKEIEINDVEELFVINKENPLEVKFDFEGGLSLKDFMDTMQPIRSFIVDSGNEYFYNKKGKRQKTRKVFEPELALKAGSVRAFISPMEEEKEQLDLFVNPTFSYELLYSVLEYAEKRDSKAILKFLSSNKLTNLKQYLNNLLKISKVFKREGKFYIKYNHLKPLILTSNSFKNIEKAISEVEHREVTVVGELYAIDTRRNWLKVYDEDNGVDWKFIYDSHVYQSNIFKVNQFVSVMGTTEAPVDITRGTAHLKDIKLK